MMILTWAPLCLLLARAAPPAAAARKEEGLNVLGGEDVAANQYDYVVGVYNTPKNSRTYSVCSGSIINAHWVLTAGHCVENSSPSTHVVEVEAGAKSLANAQTVRAEKWFTHERYRNLQDPTTRVYYDIALIKLHDSLLQVRNTAIATLPSSGRDDPGRSSTVEIVGFGTEGQGSLATKRKGILKKAEMKVQGTCRNTLPSSYCIKVVDATGRSCPGDSGGPMVYRGRVVGVSSTGNPCTTRRGDAQYTRVSSFLDWINQKIRQE
ncbi:hypothetical protein R5R35_006238 [Gryllus longicercus]|uniref:Peptidase S1 domain-containing protein n=2 Tax=Gryllus longicercus TaxID=2509291 RepID=A0AAN9W910_9ORTH